MNSTISVRKAVVVARTLITCIAIMTTASGIAILYLTDAYNLPLYLGIPAALILPIAILIAGFHASGIRWVQWAFLGVADVQELFQALQLSGFGGYPPTILEKKYPENYREIMARINNYSFADDPEVAAETPIYKRKFHQSGSTILYSMFAVLCASLVYISPLPPDEPVFILTTVLLAGGLGLFVYYGLVPSSPASILNENGLQYNGQHYEWQDIASYNIVIAKRPFIRLVINGKQKDIPIRTLYVSHVRLNHLLQVYYQRHKLRQVA